MKQAGTKMCDSCGNEFQRKSSFSLQQWMQTRFCSPKCSGTWHRRYETEADKLIARASPEPNTGCWLWLGGVRGHMGYGSLRLRDGRTVGAHRLSFELFNGPIPAGMKVCHRCDVPTCINPAHLYLGTDIENKADSVAKGRHNIGERNGHAILGPDQIPVIRGRRSSGDYIKQIARDYGVSEGAISAIVNGRSWRHIT